MTENMKKLLNSNEIFLANNFISLLLTMLYKNGIYEINELELSKKLFYYCKDPAFKALFRDIQVMGGQQILDIHDAMYNEKFFSNHIWWTSNNPKRLYLNYENTDTTYHEKKLTEYGIKAMEKIAEELANIKKIENNSKQRICIYKTNPNKGYILVHGGNFHSMFHCKLITDGDVKQISYFDKSEFEHVFWPDPTDPDRLITLKNNNARQVDLENANYTIVQGLKDDDLTYIKVYTNLMDKNSLQQISDIANLRYDVKQDLSIAEDIYTKKLVLK